MKKINKGSIIGNEYHKQVVFSKAVLWKDKELSLREDVMDNLIRNNVELLVFTDKTKMEVWTFKMEKVRKIMYLKRVGQEPQYYFPIDLAKVTPYKRQEYIIGDDGVARIK